MRSSSIKSLVITAATVVAFTLTTVPATARPAQSTQPVVSAPQAGDNGVFTRIKRIYDRFRGALLHNQLGVPIPAPAGNDTTTNSTAPAASSN